MIQTKILSKVTLVNSDKNLDITLLVSNEELILDKAQEGGLDLPYSCRSGACFDCLGRVRQGHVEQTQTALSRLTSDELKQGYVLLCSCFALSDCTIAKKPD